MNKRIGQADCRRAPAKINLTLRVGGVRPDGFHELDSVVAKITLYDELRFSARQDGRINLTVEAPFDCGPAEKNLVLRAAEALRQGSRGADIHLLKRIPPGAGLGGGSSDAATTLTALNELWELNLTAGELAKIGAALGSDVPLFFMGQSTHVSGRGERVEPVEVHPFFAVLCLSGLICPTADVYGAYDKLQTQAQFAIRNSPFDKLTALSKVEGQFAIKGLSSPPSSWCELLFNDLVGAAMRVCPALRDVYERLQSTAGAAVHMTGSGSGLFILADDQVGAERVLARLPADLAGQCVIVQAEKGSGTFSPLPT